MGDSTTTEYKKNYGKKVGKLQETTWITVNETLELLKIKSRTTMYSFLKKYNITVSKPLRKTYVTKEDILQKKNENSVTIGI